jgi:ribosomal protein S6--L-glutamate ligase/tetrahydromethanopterin:alpha-L-glutamate ligase
MASGIEPQYAAADRLEARLGQETTVWSGGVNLREADLLLVRDVPGGSLEQVIYRMDALHQLENSGVRVINSPAAIEKMVDKYYTSSLLTLAGMRVPETIVAESLEQALLAFERLGGDVVVKPLFGSRGVGMLRITDAEIAQRAFHALELSRYVFYLQRFIPHHNEDIRLLMFGDACVAAMTRRASGWKTNLSQGAIPAAYQPPEEIIDLGRRAANVVGADYCGVDVMLGEDGLLYVLEVNSMPAWGGLQTVSTLDIAAQLVHYCLGMLSS